MTTWWLREWEQRGVSIKKLAHGWAISISLFLITVQIASFYSAIKLNFITSLDWGIFIFAMTMGVFVTYITALIYIPQMIANRNAKKE
jgi:hypothetical protein